MYPQIYRNNFTYCIYGPPTKIPQILSSCAILVENWATLFSMFSLVEKWRYFVTEKRARYNFCLIIRILPITFSRCYNEIFCLTRYNTMLFNKADNWHTFTYILRKWKLSFYLRHQFFCDKIYIKFTFSSTNINKLD